MKSYKLIHPPPIIKSSSTKNFNSTSRTNFSSNSQTTNYSAILSPREPKGKRRFIFYNLIPKKDSRYADKTNLILINSQSLFKENENYDEPQRDKESLQTAKELIKRLKAWDSENLIDKSTVNSGLISPKSQEHSRRVFNSNDDQFQTLISINPSSLMLNDLANIKAKRKTMLKFEEKKKLRYNSKNRFNYDVFKGKTPQIEHEEKTVEQKLEYNIHELHQPDQYSRYVKEQVKIESNNRDSLMKVYQKMIILKMKKSKYQGIIDDIFLLLDKARQEAFLLIDLLSERRKAVDKRYEAFKIDPINPQSELEEEQKQREMEEALEKKKGRYRYRKSAKVPTEEVVQTPNVTQYEVIKRRDSKSSTNEDVQVFKKKKKTLLEVYEEKRKIRLQYLEIIQELEEKKKEYQNQFTTIQEQLKKLSEKNKEEVEIISQQQCRYKTQYQEMSKNQQNYYLAILKQGIDTRTEGLSWVVKKLIELNTSIDSSHFPSFLDEDQIDYLLDISKVSYESSQLKVILCTLKTRQRIILGEQHKSRLEKINIFTMQKEQEKGKQKLKQTQNDLDETNLETFKQRVNYILIKQETLFKSQFENKIEERQIASITSSIKDKLMESASTGKSFINDKEDNVVKFMLEHEKTSEYFEDILLLRKRIKDLDALSKTLFKEQSELFKSKYDYSIQKPNSKAETQYGIIYSALFGSG